MPAMDDAQFELWLRRKLSLPPLPSFAIPLEAFADQADRAIADRLQIPRGLYDGIAVIDARCSDTDGGVAVDASQDFGSGDGSGEYAEGGVEIVIEGDGSGSYRDAQRTITIESDGSGTYQGGGVTVEVESDGSGTFDDGSRRMEVDSDRSGTFSDESVQVAVGSGGSATYQDAVRSVEISASGRVTAQGQKTNLEVVERVLAEGLPLFPPVPHVGPVPEPSAGTSCGSVVRLDANVLFDFNTDSITADAATLLDRVGALLLALGSPEVRIDGHTDSIGTEDYNVDLSARRAAAVRNALAARNVPEATMAVLGVGETQPLVPNETPTGADDPAARQLNRRVEIFLLDS